MFHSLLFLCIHIQQVIKIIGLEKKHTKSMTHGQEREQSIEANSEVMQMLESLKRVFKRT